MSTLSLAETVEAISPACVWLFINKISISLKLLMRNFLRPPLIWCLVALLFLYPMLTILTVPLNLLLTQESIPLGFLHDSPTLMYLSEWCLLNALSLLTTFFLSLSLYEPIVANNLK
ncbi:unnamed protein product [Moneuplotes crassus]|uniref:Uncharacterized protein n=1 Tax=Euplotes crassus TaxID=5936 RepID=A0AAD1Y1E6_EUPCR|nr:unnamed protein product [Moneuplotes crassus]